MHRQPPARILIKCSARLMFKSREYEEMMIGSMLHKNFELAVFFKIGHLGRLALPHMSVSVLVHSRVTM